ncbi:pyrimidine dimer DNA glycosylase/endonuclease V [Campylobacter rectus]|uniref:pyrimidine dimer DNA glycosylase/endonuclease V n=1 Tax=Campylobacter rectus TaxID=203 RepID=UPI0028E791C2|nr:pyrimidine dimer DNA glycosylase/endonuclease V [Campylobacter rectus]
MRLWTINFKYLDAKGLVALWREALLAKNVLAGLTKGYKNHPQLDCFYAHENALEAINAYLAEVYAQACARGYKFDAAKAGEFDERNLVKIAVSSGQIEYEFAFLQKKLKSRDINAYEQNLSVKNIEIASIFKEVEGEIESWEKVKILRF